MQVSKSRHFYSPMELDDNLYQMKGFPDRINVCTTTYFDGIIAVIDPESSWVSRWQRTCMFFSGPFRNSHAKQSHSEVCPRDVRCSC